MFPYLEEGNRRNTIDGFTPDAMSTIMPWRFAVTAPHNGSNPIFTSPIKVFTCPASELGGLSPDSYNTTLPEINPQSQAALHYRANGGASTQGLVQGTWSRHAWYSSSGILYPESRVKMTDIADGTSNTLMFGETSSAKGRTLRSQGWGGIQPWTWGYYNYIDASTPANPANGWLMIDHKVVTYPIGYTGSFYTNETPFTSAHADDGALLGKHKVVIVAMEDMSTKLPEHRSPTPASIIPDKYTSLATSKLTAEVEDRVNNVEFVLEK